MRISSLRTGIYIEINGTAYKILRILANEQFQLENQKDLSISTSSKTKLLFQFERNQAQILSQEPESWIQKKERSKVASLKKDFQGSSESDKKAAMRSLEYVKALEEFNNGKPTTTGTKGIIDRVAQKLKDQERPSQNTVYRWWKKWLRSGKDIRSLLPKKRGSYSTNFRIKGEVIDVFNEVVEEMVLVREKFSGQDVYDELRLAISNLNLISGRKIIAPSRSTVYRMLSNIDCYSIISGKKGKKSADKQFRATGKGIEPDTILCRVEVDHTPLDLIVLDDDSLVPLGRPYLTLIIDKYSRSVLGYYLGYEPGSEYSVMMALRHAILPKFYVKERYPEIAHAWLAYGIPFVLVCDNGLEFHSAALKRMCVELNIELVFCPKQMPYYKGVIERFLGTLNRSVSHKLKGTTFSNVAMRGDYESEKQARVTLSEVHELIHMWILDVCNQRSNRSTRLPPDVLWQEGLKKIEPILPESRDALNLVLAKEFTGRALRHEGVEFARLHYNAAECASIRRNPEFNGRVDIRVDYENLGHIYILDEYNDEYIKVPCTSPEYAEGLALVQHKKICEEINRVEKECFDEESLMRGKKRLVERIKHLNSDRLLRERRKMARLKTEKLMKEDAASQSNCTLSKSVPPVFYDENLDESIIPVYKSISG